MKRNFSNTTPILLFKIEHISSSSVFSRDYDDLERGRISSHDEMELKTSTQPISLKVSSLAEFDEDDLDILVIEAKAKPVRRSKMKMKIKSVKKVIPKIPPIEDYLP